MMASEARRRRLGSPLTTGSPGSRRDIELDRALFERYTRWSLYVVVAVAVLAVVAQVTADTTRPSAGAAAVVIALGLATAWLCRDRLRGRPTARPALIGFALLTVAAVAAVAATHDPARLYSEGAGAFTGTALVAACGFVVLGLHAPTRVAAIGVVVGALVVSGAELAVGVAATGASFVAVATLGLGAVAVALAGLTLWTLGVVQLLSDTRSAHARLAVAEERLRFSRDLHDVYGRALSTIGIKSQLAAELARRGDDRAITEMESVHSLAQTSLSEVRGLVRGYRAIDLDTEIAGARALLRSAGANLRVDGMPEATTGLDSRTRGALAWCVREAVTNVVRHSRAQQVGLVATRQGDDVVVTITNDGVREPDSDSAPGTGLTGLGERLAEVGGELRSARSEDTFTVHARVPARMAAARGQEQR